MLGAMLPRAVALLALLLVAASARAGPAPLLDGRDVVGSHAAYDFTTGHGCYSSDPVLGVASTDLTSTLAYISSGASTTFRLHLDAIPLDESCPAIDLTFTASLAWPPAEGLQRGSFNAPCGVSGFVDAYGEATGRSLVLWFSNAPSACGLPATTGLLAASVAPPHPATTLACTPVVVPGCSGVADQNAQWFPGCGGERHATYVYVAGIGVVGGARECQAWNDGREHSRVDALFVTVDATETDCTIHAYDPVLGGEAMEPCPDALHEAVWGMDWGNLVP